jgi:signal transduction histidine kinase
VQDDPIAIRTAAVLAPAHGTVTRDGERYAEAAYPLYTASGTVLLFSSSLEDTLANVELVRERVLLAAAPALLVAVFLGYGLASVFARRISRLERAADRIAGGRFDEPVAVSGNDELAQLGRAFERMRLRLAQLERARREFIANASHELRTPIFSLGGFVELMANEDLDEQTRREFLTTMQEQVARLQKLATDLLDLSRLDAGQLVVDLEPLELASLAEAVVDEFAPIAHAAGQELEVEGRGEALADELRVLQIARILVENAIRHTPPGTQVSIRAGTAGGSAFLEVEDDGPGIPDEYAEHVFERFYRIEGNRASGSGLGLAIARELAVLMDGSLELDSHGARTRFRLVLPAAAPTRELVPA